MKFVNLDNYGVNFKQIVSGPAPTGRILNYIILAGKGSLKHKNGYRSLNLHDNIGSAWATEFMVGLGLLKIGSPVGQAFILELTKEGNKIYQMIKDFTGQFDESPKPEIVLNQINKNYPMVKDVFENIFRCSAVFENLKIFLDEKGYEHYRKDFMDDYFEATKKFYEGGEYNRDARTTTGENRVPSLIQLCEFFGYAEVDDGKIKFNRNSIVTGCRNKGIYYTQEQITESILREDRVTKELGDLAARFGMDGTTFVEAVVRNGQVQSMFRNNLIAKHGAKCMVCGLDIEELLIASHIKPAAECDVYEKADYENGLLLCANHDKLFDRHLISFEFTTGEILVSDKIAEEKYGELGISKKTKLSDELLTEKRTGYMINHNIEFHNKNGN